MILNRQVLTDLQQKVNYLQTNLNNQKPGGTGQQVVGSNADSTVLNELRETIRQIKFETNTLLQKTVLENSTFFFLSLKNLKFSF